MRIPKRTLVIGLSSLALVSMLAAAFVLVNGGARAATPYNSHPITVHPQSTYEGNANAALFACQVRATNRCYSPQQIRTAYDIQPLLNQGIDGRGHTIVIVDAFGNPYIQQDLSIFDSTFGLPDPTLNVIYPDGQTPFDFTDPNQIGWSAEISLDVQWAHAVAPGATLDLVLAKSNQDADILSATQYVINHNLGDVISQSFGEGESCVDPSLLKAEHAAFQAATAKGITLIASAGDQGAAQPTCDGNSYFLSASSPASDPLVLSIGGTHLNATPVKVNNGVVTDPGGAYVNETEWNDGSASPFTPGDAGGGGFSTIYSRPSYQAGFGVPSTSRGVPDVAYNAAVDGGVLGHWGVGLQVVIGLPPSTPAFFRFGGTSAGSPQWAGITALMNQKSGTRQGFLNPALYLTFTETPGDFHDLTVGNNTFYGLDANNNPVTVQGYNAGPGWDADGGLGTPDVSKLVRDVIDNSQGNNNNQ